jgi:hypothetical protein
MADGTPFREAAELIEQARDSRYPTDIFISPTSKQYAEINALLKRERGHQLDGIAADCMRRAYTAAANLLRDYAYEIEDAD